MWPDDAESVQQIEDDWVGENGDKRCRTVTRLCSILLLSVLASVLKSISGHLHRNAHILLLILITVILDPPL